MIVQPAFSTLLDMVLSRASARPAAVAFTYLQDGEVEGVRMTYADLDRRARSLAAVLQRAGMQGERALMLYSSSLDFVTAFFGCLYAGVVAVPAYPPKANQSFSRLLSIATDAAPRLALTTASLVSNLHRRAEQTAQFPALEWLATDTIGDDHHEDWTRPDLGPADLAFLQYTSGSTGNAKGVMVSHGNLAHNLEGLRLRWEMTPDSVMVTWLPTFHDLGLVFGVLEPLYTASHCVMMSPTAFVQRPLRWLQAITRYRATHSLAPNFAYELAATKVTADERATLDLRSWTMALNAAEPVRETTIRRFIELFAPHGFSNEAFCPAYGLAEGTLHVSGLPMQEAPLVARLEAGALGANRLVDAVPGQPSVAVVGCGPAAPGVRVLIVDPATGAECPPDAVGEIWVGGDSVAQGYWRRPDATSETFRAAVTGGGDGTCLRTGDLGFVREGQLFITGRLKDLIIVRGQNHYPQDIELTAERSHPALRPSCSAAFSVTDAGEEQLVVVCEVERTALRRLPADEVLANVRQAVAEEHELQVHAVTLVKPATIPKTSSGKIQRRACRAAFLEGTLETVAAWRQPAPGPAQPETAAPARSVQSIRAWLVEHIARDASIPVARIDPSEPFSRYGMDSVSAVSLAEDLQQWLGREVPAGIAYDYPNINALADALAGVDGARADAELSAVPAVPADAPDGAVAIIGIGCRFPGADGPEAFWRLLRDGVDAVGALPSSRARLLEGDRRTRAVLGGSRAGAFLDEVDGFDAAFFGISPRETGSMDPQQRLLLETAWEALEHAGVAPAAVAGSRTGVFVGVSSNDYSRVQARAGAGTDAWSGTGNALSIAANRLSYVLDLRGPSVAVDTACSSSLVAVHLACQSLRLGESDLAIAGGVNLILSHEWSAIFGEAQMLAPDGRCKTFDASADGYVRGEGCGVVLLKPLAAAIADGDPVLAVVRGSAVNQDGRSHGLTAPNGPSQQDVVRRALAQGGLRSDQISYVEAHGTGTSLGDPIELEALTTVLGERHAAAAPLRVGSVKTNIGHLEAAAGIAGLIKVALAMRHRMIPPHLHFQTPNPHFAWRRHAVQVPTALSDWGTPDASVYAGVSAFGFGGTNAHVVLEGRAEPRAIEEPSAVGDRGLLVLSAQTPTALRALAGRYASRIDAEPSLPWDAVCATAARGRATWPFRAAVAAGSVDEAIPRLRALAAERESDGVWHGEANGYDADRIALIVPGQGAQWPGMGRDLYDTRPEFRAAIDRCAAALAPELAVPLVDVLYGAESETLLQRTEYGQPACLAVSLALMQVWERLGVRASACVGHSVGEFAAAVAAGVLDVETACRLVAARGRLMQPLGGRMAVVWTSEDAVRAMMAPYPDVSIAAVNGPSQVMISGAHGDVANIAAAARRAGVAAKIVAGAQAFHSSQMDPMLPVWAEETARHPYGRAERTWISTVTGDAIETVDGAYWQAQVRQPVTFAAAVERLRALGYRTFVEVGPTAGLAALAASAGGDAGDGIFVPGLRRDRPADTVLREGVARLFVGGAAIDWRAWDPARRARVALPTYPFERSKYWVDEVAAHEADDPTRPVDAYEVEWVEIARAADAPARERPATVWVVCGGRAADTMASVAAGLRTRGAVVAEPAPDPPALLRALEWASARGLAGVVHVGGLDAPPADTRLEPEAVEQAAVENCLSVAAVVRAMATTSAPGARLWVVTRGAVAVEPSDGKLALLQAPLWGLGKVIGVEQPELWGGLLDLDPYSDRPVRDLIDCLPLTPNEDQLAVRSGRTYAARLVRSRWMGAVSHAASLRDDATYLITGGTGALGLQVAGRLVAGGARSIALLSRRGGADNPDAQAAIDAMEREGAAVRVFAADVANRESLSAVLMMIEAEGPPLRGIVHAAGVLDDGMLLTLDRARFERVCRPKIGGAWNLHCLTQDAELDFFVLFSSAASLVGSAGQGNYAAANAFLDTLAVSRSRAGLPALAVNWGPWAGSGLGGRVDALHQQRLASLGVTPLAADEALRAFDDSLVLQGQVAVLHVDWSRYAAEYPRSSIVRGYVSADTRTQAARGWLRDTLRDSEPADRLDVLATFVREQAGAVMRCDPSQVAPRRGFFDQGMDSLLAMELKRRLEAALGLSLPGTLTFDHPTTEGLGQYLFDRWQSDDERAAGVPTPPVPADDAPSAMVAEIQKLTPGELEAMIDRELDSLLP